MIEIIGSALYQWDYNREVTVTGVTHVHFANKGDAQAAVVELKGDKAMIPNYLLESGKPLCVYAVKDDVTLESKVFSVKDREKPADYIYEADTRDYVYKLIQDAEDATEAANQTAQDLLDAKERGEFNGPKGDPFVIIGQAVGTDIAIDNADKAGFIGMRIFGKTTQDGVPSPDAPAELVSVGSNGSITVDVTSERESKSMTNATPNGLPGVPVSSGGNYTDENGQQWICDEIDLGRGVYVQRCKKIAVSGSAKEYWKISIVQYVTGATRFDARIETEPRAGLRFCLCNAYEGTDVANSHAETIWCNTEEASPHLEFRICTARASTVDELKASLQAGTVEFIYALATPIETPLTEENIAAYKELHTYRDPTTVSNDAGAYMEIEYVMDAKKYIDSILDGGGATPARLGSVTIKASAWNTEEESLHSQVVTIAGVTEYSKVDLLPSVEQLAIFHNKDVAFVTENEDGVVTVYAIGDKPTQDYTMQVQITEVVV